MATSGLLDAAFRTHQRCGRRMIAHPNHSDGRNAWAAAGFEVVDENCDGTGVRLRTAQIRRRNNIANLMTDFCLTDVAECANICA